MDVARVRAELTRFVDMTVAVEHELPEEGVGTAHGSVDT